MQKANQLAEPEGRVHDAVDAVRQSCRDHAEQAIVDGWYSERVGDRLDEFLTTPIYVATDTRGTSLQHADAEFDEAGGYIVVHQVWPGTGWLGSAATADLMYDVLPHEFGHVLSSTDIANYNQGRGARIFGEFIAELSEDILTGSAEIPAKPPVLPGFRFDPNLEMVRAYCELADAPRGSIDLKEMSRAATGSGREVSELHEHLNDGWGINGTLQALHEEVTAYHDALPDRLQGMSRGDHITGKFMRRVIGRWRQNVAR